MKTRKKVNTAKLANAHQERRKATTRTKVSPGSLAASPQNPVPRVATPTTVQTYTRKFETRIETSPRAILISRDGGNVTSQDKHAEMVLGKCEPDLLV